MRVSFFDYMLRDFKIYCLADEADEIVFCSFCPQARRRAIKKSLASSGGRVSVGPGEMAPRAGLAFRDYFTGRGPLCLALPVSSPFIEAGTEFQKKVWRLIKAIPYGQVRTYGELAAELARPGAGRAVGRACNANPLGVIIPCHRVVARSGPGGFAGGPDLKRKLLALEGAPLRSG